jgi:hypothetical protein
MIGLFLRALREGSLSATDRTGFINRFRRLPSQLGAGM